MKKIALFIVAVLFLQTLKAQNETEQKVNAPVQLVVVYLNGAQVTRDWKGNLNAGTHRLLFSNLSPAINAQSIQANVEGNITILSVQYRVNHLRNQEKTPEIIALEDSLEITSFKLELVKGKKRAYEEEKSMILSNKSIGGHNNGVQIAELEDGADFFRKRMMTISEEWLNLTKEERKLQTIIDNLNSHLEDFNQQKNIPSHEAVVTIKCETNMNAHMQLSYFTSAASWEPFYDVRVKNTQSPVQLFYKARIVQQSNEEWKQVKIKLSTGNPTINGTRPVLSPYYVDYYVNIPQQRNYGAVNKMANEADAASSTPTFRGGRTDGTAYYIDGVRVTGTASVYQTASNIEFDIANPYTITPDGNPQTVDIRTVDLQAKYGYIVTPKLDKDAFLVARIIGNNDLYNLRGTANIYFEGTYVGQTEINPGATDTLELSLGRDKRISVERTQVKEFSSKNKVGGNIKESSTWEITIRNSKKEPIDILIEDQIPVSQNKDITVEATNTGNAQYNTETGKLSWVFTIQSSQIQKVRFSFDVKYPKDKQINQY
ncbi:MAG: DUF4139 domain-containing protein [Bacteroidia bacterium]|nr:DUF4139 domain-containing protein [Bacteroidia bacterium]